MDCSCREATDTFTVCESHVRGGKAVLPRCIALRKNGERCRNHGSQSDLMCNTHSEFKTSPRTKTLSGSKRPVLFQQCSGMAETTGERCKLTTVYLHTGLCDYHDPDGSKGLTWVRRCQRRTKSGNRCLKECLSEDYVTCDVHTALAPMPRCLSLKKDGVRCGSHGHMGGYCLVHHRALLQAAGGSEDVRRS